MAGSGIGEGIAESSQGKDLNPMGPKASTASSKNKPVDKNKPLKG